MYCHKNRRKSSNKYLKTLTLTI